MNLSQDFNLGPPDPKPGALPIELSGSTANISSNIPVEIADATIRHQIFLLEPDIVITTWYKL